jgi:hypothetical protein
MLRSVALTPPTDVHPMSWRIEPALRGVGRWFVLRRPDAVRVLAPPGVALNTTSGAVDASGGWKLGEWSRSVWDEPSIDERAPSLVTELSTYEALDLLGEEWAAEIFNLMADQLEIAREIGSPPAGEPPREELSRAGAQAASWLESELADAFPHRAAEVGLRDRGGPLPVSVPDSPPEDREQPRGHEELAGPVRPPGLARYLRAWLRFVLITRMPSGYRVVSRARQYVRPRPHPPVTTAEQDAISTSDTGEFSLR